MKAAPGTPSSAPSELILGLVAPVGVDLDGFVQGLREHLQAFGYEGRQVRLSDFLRRIEIPGEIPPPDAPEAERLERLRTDPDRSQKMGNKLYVGNLSYSVTSADLEQLFSPYGTVQSAQVITDKFSGQSKGFGFVEMGSDQEAQAAIQALNDGSVAHRGQRGVSERHRSNSAGQPV